MSTRTDLKEELLLLGVDGGGTRCRARLADIAGKILGEGLAGPANIRIGLEESLLAVREATEQCLQHAGASHRNCRIVACLALAGGCEPEALILARAAPLPFHRAIFTNDARAACVGAHAGGDGAIIIVGTGSVGWGIIGTREYRVGGWGFPLSDEGSGAWLGCEALRRTLWARDGLIDWTDLLRALFERFGSEVYAVVRWMSSARPRDYASLAPVIVAHAQQGDAVARELMRSGATYIDAAARRLTALGAPCLSLMGSLADKLEPFISDETRNSLVPAKGDALSGALYIARVEAYLLRRATAAANG